MQWPELTYKRKMELTLWTELDKAGVILEEKKGYIKGQRREALRGALNNFLQRFPTASREDIAGITGIHAKVIDNIIIRR